MLILLTIPPVVLYMFMAERMSWKPRMLLWDLDSSSGVGSIGAQASIVFLPDGKTLAIGSEDERVRLWDVPTGQLTDIVNLKRESMPNGSYYVGSPAGFSPDGKLLVTLYADGLKLWDTQTGRLKWLAISHGSAVAFSFDSKALAVYGSAMQGQKTHGIIAMWDVTTGRLKRSPIQMEAEVRAISFSPDGKMLASVGEHLGIKQGSNYIVGKGDIKILDARTGVTQQTLSAPSNPAISAAFSPTGKFLAIGSQGGKVMLWDLSTQKLLYTLRGHTPDSLGASWSVVFSPDSKLLACGGQREVQIWDTQKGVLLKRLKLLNTPMTVGDLAVGEVAFSRDGSILAICGNGSRTVTLHRIK